MILTGGRRKRKMSKDYSVEDYSHPANEPFPPVKEEQDDVPSGSE